MGPLGSTRCRHRVCGEINGRPSEFRSSGLFPRFLYFQFCRWGSRRCARLECKGVQTWKARLHLWQRRCVTDYRLTDTGRDLRGASRLLCHFPAREKLCLDSTPCASTRCWQYAVVVAVVQLQQRQLGHRWLKLHYNKEKKNRADILPDCLLEYVGVLWPLT